MLVDKIRAELQRLQIHSVNLSVSGTEDPLVALKGSLLQYWTLPRSLDGNWLLAQLKALHDAAGPEAVMSELVAVYRHGSETTKASEINTQLRLFDPQSQIRARESPANKKDR